MDSFWLRILERLGVAFQLKQHIGSKFTNARAYATIALFMFTGIRRSELRYLELADLDLRNRLISIRNGKGAKDRIVTIPPLAILENYLDERKRLLAGESTESPYLMLGKAKGRMSNKTLNRIITRAKKASGIYFAPHMLRHTFATLMLEGGCDIFSLSKMMGHSDIKTTTIYLSATVDHLKKEALKHPIRI